MTGIKLSLKQILMLSYCALVLILLLILGFKSAKLKQLATELLKKNGDLELQRLSLKREELKKKVQETDEKRKEKALAYRDYISRINK